MRLLVDGEKLDQSSAERRKLALLESTERMHASAKDRQFLNVCAALLREVQLISQTKRNSIFRRTPKVPILGEGRVFPA